MTDEPKSIKDLFAEHLDKDDLGNDRIEFARFIKECHTSAMYAFKSDMRYAKCIANSQYEDFQVFCNYLITRMGKYYCRKHRTENV